MELLKIFINYRSIAKNNLNLVSMQFPVTWESHCSQLSHRHALRHYLINFGVVYSVDHTRA